ncbi:aminoacyl-tRNA hydrolase [Candidatus Uhrbacteria bacterium]|nr:aminoacyl-tRNA hydrolase [Candidatus Uhrbacteria bacterium]
MTDPLLFIPESELVFEFSRSSGAGGQNVNRRETKVQVRWNVDRSAAVSDAQKQRIKEQLATRMTTEGDLLVVCEEERSQVQNRERAVALLRQMVEEALVPEKERIPTRPSRASKERRLREKEGMKKKKAARTVDWSAQE